MQRLRVRAGNDPDSKYRTSARCCASDRFADIDGAELNSPLRNGARWPWCGGSRDWTDRPSGDRLAGRFGHQRRSDCRRSNARSDVISIRCRRCYLRPIRGWWARKAAADEEDRLSMEMLEWASLGCQSCCMVPSGRTGDCASRSRNLFVRGFSSNDPVFAPG